MLANSASSGVSAQIKDGAASGAASRLVRELPEVPVRPEVPMWVRCGFRWFWRFWCRWFCVAAEVQFWCGSRGSSVWFHVAVAGLKLDMCSLAAVKPLSHHPLLLGIPSGLRIRIFVVRSS